MGIMSLCNMLASFNKQQIKNIGEYSNVRNLEFKMIS